MTTASVFVGTSLDGFIARTDGSLDFLPAGGGEEHGYEAGAPAEIVSRLARRGIGHLYVDGGITIQRFLQAGLIQRLIITRVPVLIGRGIPLFGPLERDIHLQPVLTRPYASGLVQTEYVVAA